MTVVVLSNVGVLMNKMALHFSVRIDDWTGKKRTLLVMLLKRIGIASRSINERQFYDFAFTINEYLPIR